MIKRTYRSLNRSHLGKAAKTLNKTRHKIFRGNNLVFFVFVYFTVIVGVMIYFGQWLSPDRFIIAGLILAMIVANPFKFLKDWSPFILLLLGYEFLRGLAPMLKIRVNIYPMINFDKLLFWGHIPAAELQKWLYTPGHFHFYDLVFTILYMMHFVLPLVFAYYLWVKKRERFQHFLVSLIVLSYVGFMTYILYPAMPPWMASQKHIIPQVYNLFNITAAHFFAAGSMPTVYWLFSPNDVAAMPSLHAAYPTLVFCYMLKYFGKKWWFFGFYVLAVWFAIVYLGQHYVIDAIAGAVYAVVVFYVVEYLFALRAKKSLEVDDGGSKSEPKIATA